MTSTQSFRCMIAFCNHNNMTSHFSSLLRRAALLKIMQNTAECLKSYTKMNGVLTLFVLAESTQVKWYKCLRLWL